jgi:DNA adenine methylase
MTTYVEPFAGGGGVGLRLLFDEYVDEVVLNDLNPGIAAFWRSVLESTDAFVELLCTRAPSIDEWHRQRATYRSPEASDLERGFATFFLNRTNRSGILGARPIGGLDQLGRWGIDARYDPERLEARIRTISRYATRITVHEQDGVDVIERYVGDSDVFVYADPPYLAQGDDLYLDTFGWEDHTRLAAILQDAEGWFLTYDVDARIPGDLYRGLRCAKFQTSHTAAKQHIGNEYAVFSRSLAVPGLDGLGSGHASLVAEPSARP